MNYRDFRRLFSRDALNGIALAPAQTPDLCPQNGPRAAPEMVRGNT